MNANLLLKNLTKLDEIKNFLSFLEVKFLSNMDKSSQLKIAKKSLDKALVQLVFDVSRRLENFDQTHKTEISNEIATAILHLKDFGDETLNLDLLNLTTFIKVYENNSDGIFLSEDDDKEALNNLKAKTLLITAERFG